MDVCAIYAGCVHGPGPGGRFSPTMAEALGAFIRSETVKSEGVVRDLGIGSDSQ